MPFSIDIPDSILSGQEFAITLDEESGDVVTVALTLRVADVPRDFGLRIGGKTRPRAPTHVIDVGGPQGAHVFDWGEAPYGSIVELIGMSSTGETKTDLGTVV